jgi:hypothetical protein
MACTFGIKGGGANPDIIVTGSVMNGISLTSSAEIAEARNEYGQVTDAKAFSQSEEVSFEGVVDGDVSSVKAGNVLEHKSKDYIITSFTHTTTNTDFQKISGTAKRTDDAATVTAYTKGS